MNCPSFPQHLHNGNLVSKLKFMRTRFELLPISIQKGDYDAVRANKERIENEGQYDDDNLSEFERVCLLFV